MTVISVKCERAGKPVRVKLEEGFQWTQEGDGRFKQDLEVASGNCLDYSACRVGVPDPDDTKTNTFSCCAGKEIDLERRHGDVEIVGRKWQFWRRDQGIWHKSNNSYFI